ncbi:MAG: hypothetical protein VYB41_03615 [Bacteroidota bacterium]|nr:hypothetical protein [Bacteroidota bacterium]
MEIIQRDIVKLKNNLEKLISVIDSVNSHHATLNDSIDLLSKKMEKHITSADSFKAQVVKQQVSSKTDSEAIQKKSTKLQNQLDGMNCKFEQEKKEIRRIKDEMNTKMNAIGERTASTDAQLQQLQTEFQAIKAKVDEIQNYAQSSTNLATTANGTPVQFVPEWVLRERKKNNIIIFGLHEMDDDLAVIKLLAADLELDLDPSCDIVHNFRVGTSNNGNVRPLVVKFAFLEKKNAMLLKAKKLKGMEKWNGVVVTHDMTKLECQVEKAWEMKLRQDAEHLNSSLTPVERSVKFFKVIGGRRERRIACFPIK